MKRDQTRTEWIRNMKFKTDLPGGQVIYDSDTDVGGEGDGLRPKATMLGALAGCTGMDVISVLKKMRAEFDAVRIEVDGELTDDHPKIYHTVEVRYYFSGANLDKSKIEKAVDLSVNRYCGVYEMFNAFAKVNHSINYE